MTIKTRFPSIEPSLDLNFAATRRLDPRITFTRASSATFVNEDGLIEAAGVDQARFDHTPTTGESLGLLVEEQRTNGLTYSEDASQWLAPTNVTLSLNQTAAPDGALTADQYLETSATGLHVQDSAGFVFVTSTVYTYSVFVKSIGGRNFEIGFPPTIFTDRFARFALSGSGSVQGSDAGVTASIQAFGNGWYRCSATNTCASGAGSRIGNFIINSSFARSYAGDVTKGLFIWGAQLETGSFPTSYIPTTTAAATRSADVASITGSNFSSWYNQTEGTFYSEGAIKAIESGKPIIGTNLANFNPLFFGSSPTLDGDYRAVGGIRASINAGVVTGAFKATSSANSAGDFAGSYNGTVTATLMSALSFSSATSIQIGSRSTGATMNVTIKRLAFWGQRLPNTTLQQITQ